MDWGEPSKELGAVEIRSSDDRAIVLTDLAGNHLAFLDEVFLGTFDFRDEAKVACEEALLAVG